MKRFKEFLFRLLVFLAITSTMLSMSCDGSLFAILILWGITILLWVLVVVGSKNCFDKETQNEYQPEDLQKTYEKRSEIKREATPEDFEACYQIAIRDKDNSVTTTSF